MFKYEVFKKKIYSAMQDSGLDIGGVYYVLKDVLNDVEKAYYEQVHKDLSEAQSQDDSEVSEEKSNEI